MKQPYSLIKATRTVLTSTLVVASMATSIVAQNPVPVDQAIPVEAVHGQAFGVVPGIAMPPKEKLGGAKQFHLQNIYAMEIRRVNAAVKLEDAQKTKLTIGAKGLAKRKSQAFVKNMLGMGMGMGMGMAMPVGGAVPAAKPKDDEPDVKFVEVKSYADIDESIKHMLDGGFAPEAMPYDDADWLKLVKAVLNPEQSDKYAQVIAANKLKTNKAMVDAGVAELSFDLGLSKDQESQLTAMVMEEMAKPKRMQAPIDPITMAIQLEGKQFMFELVSIETTKLQNVLTPPQFEKINLKLAILKSMINQAQ